MTSASCIKWCWPWAHNKLGKLLIHTVHRLSGFLQLVNELQFDKILAGLHDVRASFLSSTKHAHNFDLGSLRALHRSYILLQSVSFGIFFLIFLLNLQSCCWLLPVKHDRNPVQFDVLTSIIIRGHYFSKTQTCCLISVMSTTLPVLRLGVFIWHLGPLLT